jgi:hypothetical protein
LKIAIKMGIIVVGIVLAVFFVFLGFGMNQFLKTM